MGDAYNFKVLSTEILKLSQATDWETARKEWVLVDVYESDAPEKCLCEHFPIIEICVIRNNTTRRSTEVGNVCVKRFLGIRSDLIFAALKRIRKDPNKSLNTDAITFFHQAKVVNDWEYKFLQDTKDKRNLSDKQAAARLKVNERIIAAVAARGIQGYSG